MQGLQPDLGKPLIKPDNIISSWSYSLSERSKFEPHHHFADLCSTDK